MIKPIDKEFLSGRLLFWKGDEDKAAKTQAFADATGCIIVSKGYHTKVHVAGQNEVYENTTGNPGMAKGGSGDCCSEKYGMEGYNSLDMVNNLYLGFNELYR